MKILIDSWAYQPLKYAVIAISVVLLIIIIIGDIVSIFSGDFTGPLLSLILLMVLGAFFSVVGVLGTPVKICDEGILFQPRLNIKSLFIPFEEIGKISFVYNFGTIEGEGISECTVSYRSGVPITSGEMFTKGSLERFVNDIKPELEKKGFRYRKNDQKGRRITWQTEYIFERT